MIRVAAHHGPRTKDGPGTRDKEPGTRGYTDTKAALVALAASLVTVAGLVEPSLANASAGERFQFAFGVKLMAEVYPVFEPFHDVRFTR